MDPFTKGNDKKRGVDPLTFVIETGELCKAIDDDKKGRICALKPDDLNRLASNIRNDVNSCVLETLVDAIKGGRLKENQAAAYSYEPLTMIRTLLCLFKRPEDVYSQITKDDLAKLTDAEAENILYDVFQTIEKELEIDLAKHGKEVNPKFDRYEPTPEKKRLDEMTEQARQFDLRWANIVGRVDVWLRSDGTLRSRFGCPLMGDQDPKTKEVREGVASEIEAVAEAIRKG
jgi:hypothetical protein